jgi:hypothetical protein
MNRVLACLLVAAGFFIYRQQAGPATVQPAVVVPAPIPSLAVYRDRMTPQERADLSKAYEILHRSVAANPTDEPVIPSIAGLHDVHRAALMFVWRGVLGNQPGKYEGLRGELEGLLKARVGVEDVPLNPAAQRDAAALFDEISRSLK